MHHATVGGSPSIAVRLWLARQRLGNLTIGRYEQGAAILAELEASYEGVDREAAWMRAADRYAALAQPPA